MDVLNTEEKIKMLRDRIIELEKENQELKDLNSSLMLQSSIENITKEDSYEKAEQLIVDATKAKERYEHSLSDLKKLQKSYQDLSKSMTEIKTMYTKRMNNFMKEDQKVEKKLHKIEKKNKIR